MAVKRSASKQAHAARVVRGSVALIGSPSKPTQHLAIPHARSSGFRLESAEEHAAFAQLKLSWGTVKHQRQFERLLFRDLSDISAVVRAASRPRVIALPYPSRAAQKLRQTAKSIRMMIRQFEALHREFVFLPPAPIAELQAYLDRIEGCAKGLGRNNLSRHHSRPESPRIVKLLQFVEQHTGERHERELAVLLKRVCYSNEGHEVIRERLRALRKYHFNPA